MAKLSIQELADMVGWKTKNISTYVGRKKLVKGDDGLFDTENDKNAAFIEKEVALKALRDRGGALDNTVPANIGEVAAGNGADFDNSAALIAQLVQKNSGSEARKGRKTATEQLRAAMEGSDDEDDSAAGLFGALGTGLLDHKKSEKVYKDALARKTVKQAILEDLKIEKINGMLVPTDMVKLLMRNHTRSLVTSFEQVMEAQVTLMAGKYKIPDADVKDLKKVMREKINAGIDKAIEVTKKDLGKLVDDYSMSRGKGEKK